MAEMVALFALVVSLLAVVVILGCLVSLMVLAWRWERQDAEGRKHRPVTNFRKAA